MFNMNTAVRYQPNIENLGIYFVIDIYSYNLNLYE